MLRSDRKDSPGNAGGDGRVNAVAARLHARIMDRMDVGGAGELRPGDLRPQLRRVLGELMKQDGISLSSREQGAVVEVVLDEMGGLGPLQQLLLDPSVNDILVNSHNCVYVERAGKLEPVKVRFRDNQHLLHTIQRIVARVGRRIDESSPMVDARLPDGSRVNAIVPPLAIDGPSLSIRRFASRPLSPQDLVSKGACTRAMVEYLYAAVRSRCSIVIAGGTGAGKTTMLNVLSSFIASDERIITVEDSAELKLAQPHIVRLESRPPNLEGKGEISIRDLVRNALRMRPDRIVVGEVRGTEVFDMLQAMNTGHEGSMATIHANSTRDAISRLVMMLSMTDSPLAEETMKTLIARSVHIVVHVSRFSDGARRITGISEITGHMGATIQLHDVFRFERKGMSGNGTVLGAHEQLAQSTFLDRFKLIKRGSGSSASAKRKRGG